MKSEWVKGSYQLSWLVLMAQVRGALWEDLSSKESWAEVGARQMGAGPLPWPHVLFLLGWGWPPWAPRVPLLGQGLAVLWTDATRSCSQGTRGAFRLPPCSVSQRTAFNR